jgi:nitrous oxidase accessory protein
MTRRRPVATALLALALATGVAAAQGAPVQGTAVQGTPVPDAPTHRLAPGDPLPRLAAGDVVVLEPGVHLGPWAVVVPDVTILGHGATLDGGGVGDALTLYAPGARVEGLTVTNVGVTADLYEPDAAIAMFGCDGCVIDGLRGQGITTGVRAEDSADVVLRGFELRGDGRSPGITVYETPRVRVEGGSFDGFLDGVYLERADFSVVEGVRVTGAVRYGLHVMLSLRPTLAHNLVLDGGVGSVVMYGREATIEGNTFQGHRGPMAYGLLLQEERQAMVVDNAFVENALGTLIVSAPGVSLVQNHLDANGVGVLVQRPEAGVEATTSMMLTGNTFTRNAADVAVDDEEAALTLRGNAYDRAPLLDLDGDGIVDVPYVATSAFAARAAQQPDLTLLAHGPGIALWARLEASVPGVRGATFADPVARMVRPVERPARAGLPAAVLALLLVAAGVASALGSDALALPWARPAGPDRPRRRGTPAAARRWS